MTTFDVVIPTIGRLTLGRLLRSLDRQDGFAASSIIIVDDRPCSDRLRALQLPALDLPCPIVVVHGGGRGPAAARNRGIEQSTADWVAFLDDDVIAPCGWARALSADLEACGDRVAATQANIHVPIVDSSRRPTDWERNVRALEQAQWATADMAFRREALVEMDGFDERFPRAFREDADLALRLLDAGYLLVRGARTIIHPVGDALPTVSLRLQSGNADDPLMRALHGRDWRTRCGAFRGRRRRHVATMVAALAAVLGLLAGRHRGAGVAATAWGALTAELAWSRIAPGPRNRQELATMAATSILMPPVATWWWLRGLSRARRLTRSQPRRQLQPYVTPQAGGGGDAAVAARPADDYVEPVR